MSAKATSGATERRLSGGDVVRLKRDVVGRCEEDGVLLYWIGADAVFACNRTGGEIVRQCGAGRSLRRIASALSAGSGVPEDRALEDAGEFLMDLLDLGIAERADEAASRSDQGQH